MAAQPLTTARCQRVPPCPVAARPFHAPLPTLPTAHPTARLEASSAALASLKRTAVHHDVFRIWFDGSCGTISGLRLGRTAQQAVEWEEINAAWGQAVLLLATLAKVGMGGSGVLGGAGVGCKAAFCAAAVAAVRILPLHRSRCATRPMCAQACGMRFRGYRLLPQGSYPQVGESRAGGQVWDLHGPVSKFLCHSYDKAQVGG